MFGIFETVANGDSDDGGGFTQLGAEGLFRFGSNEQFYIGGRYNTVSGEQTDDSETLDISRINAGCGWFLTDNILTKLEYVQQQYNGDYYTGSMYEGAEFSGVVLEAVISF